jgi:hypothetical protein
MALDTDRAESLTLRRACPSLAARAVDRHVDDSIAYGAASGQLPSVAVHIRPAAGPPPPCAARITAKRTDRGRQDCTITGRQRGGTRA